MEGVLAVHVELWAFKMVAEISCTRLGHAPDHERFFMCFKVFGERTGSREDLHVFRRA